MISIHRSQSASTPLGGNSSFSMAASDHGAVNVAAFSRSSTPLPSDRPNSVVRSSRSPSPPAGTEKAARVKNLYDRVRTNFPYFDHGQNLAFMENAGGSQCPQVVIDAICNYMKTSYVQPGGGYEMSTRASETVIAAHDYMKTFTNAHGCGEVVLGPSTSQLLTNLSNCYGCILKEGDEVIVHEANHEANAGPWVKMARRRGIVVKWWKVNYDTFESDLDDLAHLLSPRTRLVAVGHVSNLLGEVLDLERVVKMVKARKYESPVRVVADGVAYTPHRAVDVAKWGVDWYVFSSYKVYGPHMAVLFGTHEAFMDVQEESPNWDFLSNYNMVTRFELGGVCHEACAGVVALSQYLAGLARIGESFSLSLHRGKEVGGETTFGQLGALETDELEVKNASLNGLTETHLQPVREPDLESLSSSLRDWDFALQDVSFGWRAFNSGGIGSNQLDRVVIQAAYDTVVLLEQPLQEKLLRFLRGRRDVIILGPQSFASEVRVPTVSFIHTTKKSGDISQALHRAGFAVRHGNMYSHRLLSALVAQNKLTVNSVDDGVVRISMVHYNTPIEVARLVGSLESIL